MAQLLDAYGTPVQKRALTQPQARAGVTGIRQIWAGSVASGLTPVRLANILRNCDDGDIHDYAVLAEEMEERDPHYASVLGTRKRAVSGVAPTVTAASESARDEEIADAVRRHIAGHDEFADLVEDCLDGLGKGFAVVEITWRTTAKGWYPHAFEWVHQRFLRFDRATAREIRLIDDTAPAEGIPLAPYKFITHKPRLKSGHPSRGGLARLAAFSWMCKAYTMKDWMAFAEIYGMPLRLGRYGPGASAEDVEKLFTAVANIGSDAAAVLPESMRIDFEQVSGTQSEAVFENLARFTDEQVSKAVLGQTMTSDNGSSQAQATVHNEVRHDIAAADARAVSGSINRDLVRPFVDLNFGPQEDYPRLSIDLEQPEDIGTLMTHTNAAVKAGLRVKSAELRRRLRLTDPDDDDEVIGGTAPAPQTRRELNSAGPADDLDEIEAEMLDGWEPVMDETLAPIIAAIDRAETLEDVLPLLDDLGPMEAGKLIEALVQGAFKARSLGDVKDD